MSDPLQADVLQCAVCYVTQQYDPQIKSGWYAITVEEGKLGHLCPRCIGNLTRPQCPRCQRFFHEDYGAQCPFCARSTP